MNKQQAREVFWKIRDQYNSIKKPKYRYANLEDLKPKYETLIKVKELVKDDPTFDKLVNSLLSG